MNLDDLMAVWQSQDAAPLQGVNQTLLHLALRQEQTKLQAERRKERWIVYGGSAGLVAATAVFLIIMVSTRGRNDLTLWDLVIAMAGACAALVAGGAIFLNHTKQEQREQHFGESLKEQLKRRIAQLDDAATRARRTSVLVLAMMGGICPAAILFLSWRVNRKPISDDGYMIISLLIVCGWSVASGVWDLRRSVQRDILPHKRRLESLLEELDDQE